MAMRQVGNEETGQAVFRQVTAALREIEARASSEKVSCTSSISNRRWYGFRSAFFGSFRMRTRALSSRSSNVAITGRRPMNSGISQYFY